MNLDKLSERAAGFLEKLSREKEGGFTPQWVKDQRQSRENQEVEPSYSGAMPQQPSPQPPPMPGPQTSGNDGRKSLSDRAGGPVDAGGQQTQQEIDPRRAVERPDTIFDDRGRVKREFRDRTYGSRPEDKGNYNVLVGERVRDMMGSPLEGTVQEHQGVVNPLPDIQTYRMPTSTRSSAFSRGWNREQEDFAEKIRQNPEDFYRFEDDKEKQHAQLGRAVAGQMGGQSDEQIGVAG